MSNNQLSEREVALLLDLGRLLKKHGPEVFRSLAASLADPDWSAQVSTVLGAVAAAAPQRSVTGIPKRGHSASDRVEALLQRADRKQAELLEPLVHQLVTRELLPRLTDLTEFASTVGLPAPRSKSRGEAVVQIVRAMLALPTEELEKLALDMQTSASGDRRSLEGWSRIIERSRRAATTGPEAR